MIVCARTFSGYIIAADYRSEDKLWLGLQYVHSVDYGSQQHTVVLKHGRNTSSNVFICGDKSCNILSPRFTQLHLKLTVW